MSVIDIQVYDVSRICKIVKGQLLQDAAIDQIQYLAYDSRKITHPERSVFFAIQGRHRDGHDFIPELYTKGVRAFVIESDIDLSPFPDAAFIKVEISVKALQRLAAEHRSQFDIPVIGITGSNGKTIVKEWLYQMLSPEHQIVRSPKSYNSQIGVPLSVWQMDSRHTFGIFEAGISQSGEMEHLEPVIRPKIGLITNIHDPHNEGFLNDRHKTREKLSLFNHSDILIYCADYDIINDSIRESLKHFKEGERYKRFTWAEHTKADIMINSRVIKDSGTEMKLAYEGKELQFLIPFRDDASVENAMHCIVIMIYMGYEPAVINERLGQLGKVEMRLELKTGDNSCTLINDSYNSDLSSLAIALDFLNAQKQHPGRSLILSDIYQTGMPDKEWCRLVFDLVSKRQIKRFIGVGEALVKNKDLFNGLKDSQLLFYSSTEELIEAIDDIGFQNESILLKGARKFRFERLSRELEQKIHETVLEIRLASIVHNLNFYQSLLNPGTKIMAMVKAFSYGSGSAEIASLLQFHKVDYLAVAYADEGVALRKAGVELPIMVMNPEPATFPDLIRHRLEPELFSQRILDAFAQALDTNGEYNFPIHIKLDTGMHRLGFDEEDIPDLAKYLSSQHRMHVKSLFTHLAASEDPQQDEFTLSQAESFTQMADRLSDALGYKPMRHALNSAGIVRFPQYHFDMVRLGLGLYGLDPAQEVQSKLELVSTLRTTISQIKELESGDTVGYNRRFKAEKGTRIATVNIGYADGVPRTIGNGQGYMLVADKPAPIVGSVCMDMCMLDITDIPNVHEGDQVIVFGNNPNIRQLAKWAGTIPYEILAGISNRVRRVYYQE